MPIITNTNIELAKAELLDILGEQQCLYDHADKILYGYDHSSMQAEADIITLPSSTDEVQKIIAIAYKYQIPVIARGQATNTCGATVPLDGGIVIATQNLNKILDINYKDKYAIVQPGLINLELQNSLHQYNLFWPPDPSSAKISTIGGNLACNAAGPSAVKYGVTRDHVLGLTFVTGDGNVIKTGCFTTKSVVGYDLTRLLIGSEGTLGIITESVLKLSSKPEVTHTIRALYSSIDAATEVITNIMQLDFQASALELLDENCLNLIKSDQDLNIKTNSKAMLIIETNGSHKEINNYTDIIYNIAKNNINCLDISKAEQDQERQKLWQARKSLSPKLRYIAPHKINEDIAVPISRLPELIRFINNLSNQYNLPIVNFGHAGNGNIHVNLLINKNNQLDSTNAQICLDKIFHKTIELRGTLSGEHGVGLAKAPYINYELSDNFLELSKKIKQVFDPKNILNPQLVKNY